MKRPGSLNFSAVAVYCCQTDFMIGPTTFGSLKTGGSVPRACALVTSPWAAAFSSAVPDWSTLDHRAAVGSQMNAGLPF